VQPCARCAAAPAWPDACAPAAAAVADNSRRADSRLNHVLKNKSAEARYLIDEVADELRHLRQSALSTTLPATPGAERVGVSVDELLDNLAKVQLIHEQTVEWTHMRELFMQLQHGVYKTSRAPTDLRQLLRRVVGSDESLCRVEVSCRDVMCIDASILQLQLEEARSNAIKYKEPGTPLVVRAQLEQASAYAEPSLHVTMDNENRGDLRALSPEECVAVFEPGRKGTASGALSPSDGLGLDNVGVAAAALGGRAWLSTYCHPETHRVHTVFHASCPAIAPSDQEATATRRQTRASGTAPRRHQARPSRPSSHPSLAHRADVSRRTSSCNSSNSASGDETVQKMMAGATPLCLGLDDSETLQLLLDSVFAKLSADPNSRTLGSTVEEQEGFVPLALGQRGLPPADIVVDQNLNLPLAGATSAQKWLERPSGTEIARKLAEGGFEGMIVIHSGLTLQELEEVNALPHVDLVVSKGYSPMRLASELAYGFGAKMEGRKKDAVVAEPAPPGPAPIRCRIFW
jgi:hypothetical protein